MLSCRHLTISGRVQGVGYRSWMCSHARKLGLDGWVRNRSDGTVEALVCGTPAQIEDIIRLCHEGPMAARVVNVEAQEVRQEVEKGFQQLSTV